MDLSFSLRGHEHPVTALYIVSWKYLISGDESGSLFVWSLETRRPLVSFPAFDQASVLSICSITPTRSNDEDSCIVLAQGRHNMIYFYQFQELLQLQLQAERVEGRPTVLLTLPAESLFFCGCKARGNKVAFTLSSPSRLCVYSLPLALASATILTKELLEESVAMMTDNIKFINLPSAAGSCLCLEFVHDQQVVTGHEDGSLHLHDLTTGTTIRQFAQKHSQVLLNVAVLADCVAISGGADDYLLIHNLFNKESVKEQKRAFGDKINLESAGVSALCVFEGCIVACCWSGEIVLYDLETGSVLSRKREHRKSIRCAAFSSLVFRSWGQQTTLGKEGAKLSKTVFIGSEDCRVSCWKLA